MIKIMTHFVIAVAISAVFLIVETGTGIAGTASEIDSKVTTALKILYGKEKTAQALGKKAKAVLVFPDIVKGGLIIGGQYGEGAMRNKSNKSTGYYKTVAASYGLQIGVQKFGYAMFLMNDKAVEHVKKSDGWEVGTGPSIVVMDKGAAGALTTTTYKEDIYVFFFDHSGLMAGLGIQGTKVSRIQPDK